MATRFLMATAAALLATVSGAYAVTVTGTIASTPNPTNSAYTPTINYDGSNDYLGYTGNSNTAGNFTENLTGGTTSTAQTLFQVSPVNGNASVGTQTGTIAVTFTFNDGSAVTGVSTSAGGDTATLSNGKIYVNANYELFYQANPQTDCITWNSTTCTAVANDVVTGIGETLTVSFADGHTMAVNLYNWSDWTMTPDISFDYDPVKVPEPASIALFGSGLLGVFMIARRRRQGGAAPAVQSRLA